MTPLVSSFFMKGILVMKNFEELDKREVNVVEQNILDEWKKSDIFKSRW